LYLSCCIWCTACWSVFFCSLQKKIARGIWYVEMSHSIYLTREEYFVHCLGWLWLVAWIHPIVQYSYATNGIISWWFDPAVPQNHNKLSI
jgi:hypothetical protein